MRAHHLVLVGVVAAVSLFFIFIAADEQSRAQGSPGPYGWTSLGQVALDKNGCASCPATFPTPTRHPSFGLATDSPFAISLNGRIDVTCTDGNTYNVALRSATRAGLFQVFPNSCVNLDSKEIKLAITSVSLSPPDAERTVALTVYGKVR